MIESVTLHLEDGTDYQVQDPATAIDFAMTPAEAYATVDQKAGAGKVYFNGEVGLKYKGEEDLTISR